MPTVALYARYSSDNQRDASIEDQLRICRERAEREGWRIVDSYSDRSISGASLIRPGIQALMADAQAHRFDIVLAESLDRISRDQEDIAGVYKRLTFAGVRMVTLSEGDISELHIGLKGTMGALYLKDLADKTRRGLHGRVEHGKSGGGNSYGYRVVHRSGPDGEPIRGEREIDPVEANIVRRIFTDYAAGKSPRTIAHELNAEGVAGPRGRDWGPSTLLGNVKRGNGILNNELYIGRLVWNRQRFLKDPDTGKRVSRLNPENEWVTQDVPELRIIDDALWTKVKKRQTAIRARCVKEDGNGLTAVRRTHYALLGPDQVRRVRRRLFEDLSRFLRLLDGEEQGDLLEHDADHTTGTRNTRSQRAPQRAHETGTLQGILRGVYARDQSAADGSLSRDHGKAGGT